MTSNVVTVDAAATLYDAMLMLNDKKIKHLPVVSDNSVVGIITAMDILRVQPALMEIMASKAETPSETESSL
jgi:signal-transduction protein with cAMP-binding, CBS, and nucleotidyltransferase domain